MTLDLDRNARAVCSGRFGAMLVLVAAGCVITGCASTQAVQTDAAAIANAPVSSTIRAPAAEFADAKAAQSLVQAIDERLTLMRDVAAAKWLSGAPILDAAREADVLQRVAVRAESLGLDSVTTQAFFAGQMRLARDRPAALARRMEAGRPLRTVRRTCGSAGRCASASMRRTSSSSPRCTCWRRCVTTRPPQ